MRRYKRRSQHPIDWIAWLRSFGAAGLGLIGVLTAFYFTTKETLNRHESQFVEIGKKFDSFNTTLQKNYDDWAKQNRTDQERADVVRKEFLTQITSFGISGAALKVQVDNVAKQLDSVTNKLDQIQTTQHQRK